MSQKKLAPADVIQQARTKLWKEIRKLAWMGANSMVTVGQYCEQEARTERAISVYTRTVRNARKSGAR